MHGLNVKSKFTVSLFLSLAVLLFGFAGMAQAETQTPSETVGEGARKVIEGVLSEYDLEEELEDWESLIDSGVPPGIVVSVVKSLETGHLSRDELGSVFTDLEENVVNDDTPVGLVIKSIKTTYQLPEEVGKEEDKPDKAGPPEDNGQNGESQEDDEKGQSEGKGSSEGKEEEESEGKSENAGPPEDNGQNGESQEDDDKGEGE